MDQNYKDFVERMGSFEMELPELTDSPGVNFSKIKNEELKHYGIMGMKWGVRRGSSSGGSTSSKLRKVTPAQLGKVKTAADEGSRISREGGNLVRTYNNVKNARRAEDLSKLSDAELKSKIDRMNLEQQYSNLSGAKVSKGQVYAKSALETTGSVLAIGSSAVAIALAMKQMKG